MNEFIDAVTTPDIDTTKLIIAERALLQRVNRKLAPDDLRVCRQRPMYDSAGWPHYSEPQLGRYFVVDARTHGVVDQNVDLEDLPKNSPC